MPRFNSKADWCSGLGGDGVYAIVNGQKVNDGPGGAGPWLTDEEFVTAHWTTFSDFRAVAISKSGQERKLKDGVFGHVYGGGGRWGTVGPDGFHLDDGTPSLPIVSFGQDGSLVTWASGSQGLIIAGRKVTDATVYEQHIVDANTGVWLEGDGPHTIGLPVPKMLPGTNYGPRIAFDGTRWWILYLSTTANRLVLHPFDSFEGYLLSPPFDPHNSSTWAYQADLVIVGGAKHVIWATIQSELLGQISGPYVADVQFPLQDVSKVHDAPPPPPPPPDKPKPEPTPVSTFPVPSRVKEVVQALYELNVPLAEGDDDERRALILKIAQQLAFELGPSWGAKDAGGGRPMSKDAIAHLEGSVLFVADCFNGSTRKPAVPDVMEDSTGQHFIVVTPVNHLGAPVGGDKAPGTPAPTPGPVPQPAIEAAIKQLIFSVTTPLKAEIAALKLRVDSVENRPTNQPEAASLNGKHIALRTNNGHVVCAEDGGGGVIHSDRLNVGGWETFTIEEQ